MKKNALFIALALLLAATNLQGSEAPPLPEYWTTEQAVAFALSESPDSTIAQKRIEQARAALSMAKSADYPQMSLSGEYAQTNNPMYSFGNILNQGAFDNSINFNDPGRTDNLQLKAQINYRLYDGGKKYANQAAAAAGIDTAKLNLVAVHRQLGFEVVKTFQAIIQAEKMVEVREEALGSISAALEVGRARYDAGDLLKQELLNLELQQSRASENLIQSRHQLEITKRIFLNLLGLRGKEVEIDSENPSRQQLPDSFEYQQHYRLQRLQSIEQAAKAELKRASGDKMPTVDAFASYQVDNGWVLGETGDSWMAGLRVNYSLYDGGKRSAEIASARLKIQEIQGLIKQAELAISLDIQKAQLDYQQAKQRLTVTEKMVGVAEEVIRLSRARFTEGVILASDLIDVEMRLSDARARQLAAKAGYRVAIANLRRASGLEQFPSNN